MPILLVFLGLQLCDVASTLVFLRHGVVEGNPLVAGLIVAMLSPVAALALVKAGGCALGCYAWRTKRVRLLRRANLFFGACVAWNLLAILKA
jgi:multisubunit Na+/H+ antiporter MnhG subunit